VGDRGRKPEGTNRGRAEARGAKPLWVSSRYSTRTTCAPVFSAPLLAYARDRRPHAMVMTGRSPGSIAQASCGETVRPGEARVAHAGAGHGEENHRTMGRESSAIQSSTLGTPMSCPSRWIHVLCVCNLPSREAVPFIYCCSTCPVRRAGRRPRFAGRRSGCVNQKNRRPRGPRKMRGCDHPLYVVRYAAVYGPMCRHERPSSLMRCHREFA
jgi:hypothetical protein